MPTHPKNPLPMVTPFSNSKGRRLNPNDLLDHFDHQIDRDSLQGLAGKSILNPRQFDRRSVVAIAQLAATFGISQCRDGQAARWQDRDHGVFRS